MLEIQHTERPTMLSSFDSLDDTEFKSALKKLVKKTLVSTEQMEEEILKKISDASLSRSWKRSSGVRTAPMKILFS